MSWEASAWAMKQKLPCVSKMLLIALSDHHNKITGQCNPSIKLLAEEAGLAISTANKHMAILAKAKLITIVQGDRPDGSRSSSRYTLHVGSPTPGVDGHAPGVDQEPGIEPGDAPIGPSDSNESSAPLGVHSNSEISEEGQDKRLPSIDVPVGTYSNQAAPRPTPEWYRICALVPGFHPDLSTADSWREQAGISVDLAERKAYALQDWWPTLTPAKQVRRNPYSTWQNWCRDERDKSPPGSAQPPQSRHDKLMAFKAEVDSAKG